MLGGLIGQPKPGAMDSGPHLVTSGGEGVPIHCGPLYARPCRQENSLLLGLPCPGADKDAFHTLAITLSREEDLGVSERGNNLSEASKLRRAPPDQAAIPVPLTHPLQQVADQFPKWLGSWMVRKFFPVHQLCFLTRPS